MYSLNTTRSKGFTLVEIAIVLVIIGLLLGGIIKGREMIAETKLKKLIKFTDEVSTAIYTYQDKYRSFPGDDSKAKTNLAGELGGCAADDIQVGNSDGKIDGTKEHFIAVQHLACANLIKGSFNGTSELLLSPYGNKVSIMNKAMHGLTGHVIYYAGLSPSVAEAMDKKIDDGNYQTGSVRATSAYTEASLDAAVFY